MRNLDMTALRAFVTVADTGGVTRASGFLNLTQSAVSMQLKRLEKSVGVSLLDRSARKLALTRQGEQMLSYARRMLSLNDEAMTRLTAQDYEGQLALGVPSDIPEVRPARAPPVHLLRGPEVAPELIQTGLQPAPGGGQLPCRSRISSISFMTLSIRAISAS